MTRRRNNIFFGIMCASVFFTASCGSTELGTVKINDPAPSSGQIVAQGNFTGLNGKTVSGIALVYQMSDGSHLIRLEGLSAPAETGLQVVAKVDSTIAYSAGLKGATGNQNYPTTIIGASTWNSIKILSTQLAPPENEYGAAILESTNQ